jgi:SAM-dependent methyltransferase
MWGRGSAYERYIGRWSSHVPPLFLDWLDLPAGLTWIDVGCGTGALAESILDRTAPSQVLGVDPAAGFVAAAAERLGDRASVSVAPADDLPLSDSSVDCAVSGLVLTFVPDATAAVVESMRVCRGGGTVAGYVWDYAGRMDLMRRFWDAATDLDARAADVDEGPRFPLARPAALATLFSDAGCADVETTALDVATVFADFDDYWEPFLGGQGPAPAYAMSLEPDAREALRRRLDATLPREPEGSIALVARAWAVRGLVR